MELITFDGQSASGKKTHTARLISELDAEIANNTILTQVLHIVGMMPTLKLVVWPCMFSLAYEVDWKNRGIIVQNTFWRWFIDLFTWNRKIDLNRREKIMDSIDTLLLTISEDIFPTCSFYLDLGIYEAKLRFIRRELQAQDLEGVPDINIEGLQPSGETLRKEREQRKIVEWLANRYDFFHVIDASQEEDKVFEEILSITKRAL